MRTTRSKTKTPVKDLTHTSPHPQVSPLHRTPIKTPTKEANQKHNKRTIKADQKHVQASQKIAEISQTIANQEDNDEQVTPKNKRTHIEDQSTARNQ
jgi:hypothetical protein